MKILGMQKNKTGCAEKASMKLGVGGQPPPPQYFYENSKYWGHTSDFEQNTFLQVNK